MPVIRINQIYVYPVKSMKGIATDVAEVQARGLQFDRRWMVVDEAGRFLSQRELPRMALIDVRVDGKALAFAAPSMVPLTIPLEYVSDVSTLSVRIWRSTCDAVAVDEVVDAWLSEFLGVPCRLVHMPDSTRRAVNPDYARAEGIVSFADGYPMTLIGESSLADLNMRLNAPLPMDRFRPNFVVSDKEPFSEDTWKTLRIGDILFHAVKPCDRCMMTTIDQETGIGQGEEPLKTLAAYRAREQKILFGVFLIPENDGRVRVGDIVEVLEA